MNFNKISFGTVCMNRLHHLQKTLIKNIENNIDYPRFEFIVLDYNSSDGLEPWVKENLTEYIEKGILKFYRTSEPLYFDRSHSRNLMFKLATGNIICNIDADNYTGENFASYINNSFNKEDNIFLVADTHKKYYFLRNAFGRFCVRKENYFNLGGLDEKMKSYGSETVDFYQRLNMAGIKEIIIENTKFLKTISHGDEERISNEFFLKSLKNLFIKYQSFERSEILFFYTDNTFENVQIIPEKVNTHLPASLKEGSLRKGIWKSESENIILEFLDETKKKLHYDQLDLVDSDDNSSKFFLIQNQRFLLQVAKNYAFITNSEISKENQNRNKLVANKNSFGLGTVHKNFSEKLVIQ